MSYKVSFADGDMEKRFFDSLAGYTVQIRQGVNADDYTIVSFSWDDEFQMPELTLRAWDHGRPAPNNGIEKKMLLSGEEEVYVY